ncbi:oxidoreductase-like protein [Saccharata proteae CBS 121410]|uniref:Oxidoreductase-like protein n=1 Tax=Saccharata proteae CBS 121410 TaxID=1314787 RepID=A0A9P4HYA1_9PEZI|nr:oxidoreductase-like protein [Saccharata proteae CBS 121410]
MINFAVIGTSWITTSFIESAQSTGLWNLRAVYSRSETTAQSFASAHNVTETHTSLATLAASPNITTVYIASVNSAHYDQAATLLRGGKHVILEKPATSTTGEFASLCEIARANKTMLLEAFRHMHEANFHALRAALPKLGPVYGASLNYASYSSRYNAVLAGQRPNIFNLDLSGGALVDLAVYPISAAVALFGKPVAQSYAPVIVATGADGGGFVTLRYDGFAVCINASKIYSSAAPSEVYGERGSLVLNAVTDIQSVEFVDAKTKAREQLAVGPAKELNLSEEAREFARILEEGDWEAQERLEGVSRAVIAITEDLRRQNGLTFAVERE